MKRMPDTNMSRWKGPPEELSYAVPGMTMQDFIVEPVKPCRLSAVILENSSEQPISCGMVRSYSQCTLSSINLMLE
jgi:hypothetical protein